MSTVSVFLLLCFIIKHTCRTGHGAITNIKHGISTHSDAGSQHHVGTNFLN